MNGRWIISAYTAVVWQDGRIVISSNASGARLVTNDFDLLRLLQQFAQPRTIEEVLSNSVFTQVARVRPWVEDLIRAGILCSAAGRESPALHCWDSAALAYHRESSNILARRNGAPTPARRVRSEAASIPLDKTVPTTNGLPALLSARRSHREWLAGPMTFTVFSHFLALCARDRKTPDDATFISRPYPSAGGIYSLEVYPVLAEGAVESISAGLYRYRPESHGLQEVSASSSICSSFLENAGIYVDADPPPIVLLITSHFAMQAAIYGVLAYSLILKEVGCLLQTMYLAAEHLHLGGCALGGGISGNRLARICGTSELAEPLVGEFLLGPR
jgi:SagB-type dehydrogenase family enzyme